MIARRYSAGYSPTPVFGMEKRQPIDDLIDLWVWIRRQLKKKAPKRTQKVGEPCWLAGAVG